MVYRFDQSRLISEQMIKEALRYIANHVQTDGLKGDHLLTVFSASQTGTDQVINVALHLPPEFAHAVTQPGSGDRRFGCTMRMAGYNGAIKLDTKEGVAKVG